jgi:hypothetical protein
MQALKAEAERTFYHVFRGYEHPIQQNLSSKKEIRDDKGSLRRVDEACVLDEFRGKRIVDFLSAVIVPNIAIDQARKIFGDKVRPLEDSSTT